MKRKMWIAGVVLFLLAAAGCKSGGKNEDCATVTKRLMPFLTSDGRTVSVEDMQKLIERCQRRAKGSTDDVLFRCVASAKDDPAIATCMADARSVLESLEPAKPAKPAAAAPRRDGGNNEAELQLAKIRTNAKAAYNTDASYPVANAPLTPATPCCQQPGGRCEVKARDWDLADWRALDFQLDEPFDFQYSYTGTATSYVATAVGDPGCTGKPVTWVLTGTATEGTPSATLSRQ
jgi:hypothetical protein